MKPTPIRTNNPKAAYLQDRFFEDLLNVEKQKLPKTTFQKISRKVFGFGRSAEIVKNRYRDLNATLGEYNKPPLQDCNFQPKSDLLQLVEKNMPSSSSYNPLPKTLSNSAEEPHSRLEKEKLLQELERTTPAKTTTSNNSSPSVSPAKPTLIGRLVDMARSTFGMSR